MTSQSTSERGTIITEADLAALDDQTVTDEALEATDPINRVFLNVGSVIAVAATVILLALTITAVVLRYFFNSSLPLASEGPTYLFPWLICGGAIVAQAQMSHPGVDFFLSMLKGKAYDWANVAIWVFVTVLLGYVGYLAIYMAPAKAAQLTPIMGLPQLGSFMAFIIMCFAMAIQAGVRVYFILRDGARRTVVPEEDPAEGGSDV
jgi:TRAP-type C4-dicarboxylate transport system permease small subunit